MKGKSGRIREMIKWRWFYWKVWPWNWWQPNAIFGPKRFEDE